MWDSGLLTSISFCPLGESRLSAAPSAHTSASWREKGSEPLDASSQGITKSATCQLDEVVFIYFLIYLFMAVLGLRFCARALSSCGERGPLFIAVRGPLTVAAPPVAEHRLQTRRRSSCGSRAQLLCGMWDPPRPGLEPVSPALAGRFSTTAPPGKPLDEVL